MSRKKNPVYKTKNSHHVSLKYWKDHFISVMEGRDFPKPDFKMLVFLHCQKHNTAKTN